jgi:hypothetical protein
MAAGEQDFAAQVAGMDEEGLRRTVGELLAANAATQANFDEIRQQFPISAANVANDIPTWGELEEGGLEPPNPEEGEGESFEEQLGGNGFSDLLFVEVKSTGAVLAGGDGLVVERVSTGFYRIFMQTATQKTFGYPGAIRSSVASTSGEQAVNVNINLITSKARVKGWEIVLVRDVAGSTPVDANFHFFAANINVE